jgi:hypothetical protein
MKDPIAVCIPFEGFYHSVHDMYIDQALEMAIESYESGDEECEPTASISTEAFTDLAKAFTEQWLHDVNQVSGLALQATVTGVHKVRDYFSDNDAINAEMPLEHLKTVRKHLLAKCPTEWAAKVHDTCSSHDGFVSFVSNDIESSDWSEDISKWRAHQIRLMLTCLTEFELGEDWENGIAGDLSSNGHYDQFLEYGDE